MNNNLTKLGYFTLFFTALYLVLKFQKLPGPYVIMLIAGALMAIYFPLLFLKQYQLRNNRKPKWVHKFGAILLFMLIISVILNFQHWSIVRFEDDKIVRLLSIHPMLFNSAYFGFSFIFVPWFIYENYRSKKENLGKNIVGGLGLAIISYGLIGNQMHLPFWPVFLTIGNILFIIIYIPWYIKSLKNNTEKQDYTFQILIVTYIIITFIYLTFMRSPVTYQDVIMRMN